ncbi:MAG: hypothetical protein ACRDNL_17435, partial [Spirillospora sp.]
MTHDLRLLAPALATWLTAAATIGLPASFTYVLAATAALAALYLLAAHRRPRRRPGTGPTHAAPRSATARSTTARSAATTYGNPRHRRSRRGTAGVVLVCVAASAAGVALRATAVDTGPVR